MRILFKLILLLFLLSPFALAAVVWFALEDNAMVFNTAQLSHQDIARAQAILKKNDPRRFPAGTEQNLRISEKDLNLATNYIIQKLAKGGTQIQLHSGYLYALGTVRIPKLPIKPYLNVQLKLEEDQGQPRVSKLQIGQLPVPAFLADIGFHLALKNIYQSDRYKLANDVLKKVVMQKNELLVTYHWNPALIQQARDTLLTGGDKDALNAYYNKLIELQRQGMRRGSLTQLLQPMFKLAEARSKDHDPIIENRSLLAVLGSWSSGHGLSRLVPEATSKPAGFGFKLEGRLDFGQHFLTSAALAANGDAKLADAVGLFKEIADSQGGSGFSFTDLAADRAGTRFGELATRSESDARKVQKFMAAGIRETDIMPKAHDLPEGMTEAQFKQRYGEVGSPVYDKVTDEIERRIANTKLYQN